MKKALVLGGTKFFGTFLVQSLLDKGFEVTVATRGLTKDSLGDSVKRVICDRSVEQSLINCFENTQWDIVFDQICYSSEDARIAIKAFEGKTDRYIVTSSQSVYVETKTEPLVEEDYNPYRKRIVYASREDLSYEEGKQQTEAVLFQQAPFPVTAVRIPIVLGEKDYTERLLTYIKKVKYNEDIFLTNPQSAELNFISEQEAGHFLAWMGTADFTGPINACSIGSITLQDLMDLIEDATNQKVNYTSEPSYSPYNVEEPWTMSASKATKLGYSFSNLMDWLPDLIRKLEKKV
ncbi:NAD-dependent epimerase/dehydratase family protein [Aquibacillus kalidii]|uniref:NAD-dependent epimerase/dehydratase family protein n=1 Tax=Aquibacillus kalidii TaxID=2762597 RepID=UPI001646B706|nr:NAD-dependent epimerase/dehydratase family protein [Aquibacillus kalidii]